VNSSNNLMPGNRRRHYVLLPMGVNALVRPAHGTAEDPQNNLPGSNRGLRNILDPHVSRPVKNCCFHLNYDLSPTSFGWYPIDQLTMLLAEVALPTAPSTSGRVRQARGTGWVGNRSHAHLGRKPVPTSAQYTRKPMWIQRACERGAHQSESSAGRLPANSEWWGRSSSARPPIHAGCGRAALKRYPPGLGSLFCYFAEAWTAFCEPIQALILVSSTARGSGPSASTAS